MGFLRDLGIVFGIVPPPFTDEDMFEGIERYRKQVHNKGYEKAMITPKTSPLSDKQIDFLAREEGRGWLVVIWCDHFFFSRLPALDDCISQEQQTTIISTFADEFVSGFLEGCK